MNQILSNPTTVFTENTPKVNRRGSFLQPLKTIDGSNRPSTNNRNAKVFSLDLKKTIGYGGEKREKRFDSSSNRYRHPSAKSTAIATQASIRLTTTQRSQRTTFLEPIRNSMIERSSAFNKSTSRDRSPLTTQRNSVIEQSKVESARQEMMEKAKKKIHRRNVYINVNSQLEDSKVTPKLQKQLTSMLEQTQTCEALFQQDADKNRDTIFDYMGQMYQTAQNVQIEELIFKTLELNFTISTIYKDKKKAIQFLKQYKSIATVFQDDKRKGQVYKWLANLYQEHREYEKAIRYLKKLLRLAWATDDKDTETVTYDLLGIQYYYLGKLEEAEFYHSKMTNGDLEPEDSPFYKLAQHYYKNNHVKRRLETVTKDEAYKVYISSGEEDDIHIAHVKKDSEEPNVKVNKGLKLMRMRALETRKNKFQYTEEEGLGAYFADKNKKRAKNSKKAEEIIKRTRNDKFSVDRFIRDVVQRNKGTFGAKEVIPRIQYAHLSTNRQLDNFHYIQHMKDQLQSNHFNSYFLDNSTRLKVMNIFHKYSGIIEKNLHDVNMVLQYRDPKYQVDGDDGTINFLKLMDNQFATYDK